MVARPSSPARKSPSRPAGERTERLLLGAVGALLCLGLVMIYSVASARAVLRGESPTALVKNQLMYAVLGLIVLFVVARLSTATLRRLAPLAVGAAFALLAAVLVMPLGVGPIHSVLVNGAKRWLAIGPIQIQPSEIAKIAIILWIAAAVARDPKRLTRPKGLVPFAALTGLLALLIVVQPDLGTTGLVVMTAFVMMFVAGAPVRKLGAIAGGVAGAVMLMILTSDYQRARVTNFLNPWADATGDGYQSVQALIAIGSGGIWGNGLGNSIQKNFYLPESQNDMILAIIGEELGLLGILGVIAAFVVIGIAGYRVAIRAKDVHQRLLAAGVTSLICIQAAINLGQVMGLLPVTGVPLPFVSAGGTSLVVFLAAVGILINISRRGAASAARTQSRPATRGDRGGGDGRPRQAGARDRRRLAS